MGIFVVAEEVAVVKVVVVVVVIEEVAVVEVVVCVLVIVVVVGVLTEKVMKSILRPRPVLYWLHFIQQFSLCYLSQFNKFYPKLRNN